MAATEMILDMSNPREKQLLLAKLRDLQGMCKVTVGKYRQGRSLKQNRYYWGLFIPAFIEGMAIQGVEIDKDTAHLKLKEMFAGVERVNVGGQTITVPKSTADMTTVEFNAYLDRVAVFLAEYFGVQVPEPSVYHSPLEPGEEGGVSESTEGVAESAKWRRWGRGEKAAEPELVRY